jgi:hypothetical protein
MLVRAYIHIYVPMKAIEIKKYMWMHNRKSCMCW